MNSMIDFIYKKRVELIVLEFICAIYFFSYFYRLAVPGICFDELQKSFAASAGAIAALGSIFFYIYGLMQPFAGALVDRFGGRRVLIMGGTLMGIGGMLFPLSYSIEVLYFSRAITALGASCIFLGLVKEIDALFDASDFAIVLGIALLVGYSGGLTGTLPFAKGIELFGWRASLFFVGLLNIIFVLGAFLFFLKVRRVDKRISDYRNSTWLILKNKNSYPTFLCASINFGVYFLIQTSIGKKMFTDLTDIYASQAAFFIFLMMLTCIVFTILSAIISKIFGNRRKPILIIFALFNSVATLALALNLLIKPSYYVMEFCFLLLAIAASGSPISVALIKEINPPSAAGTSVGLANAAAYIFVAIIINLSGVILDCFRNDAIVTSDAIKYPAKAYVMMMMIAFIFAVIGLLASSFLRESRGKNIYKN